MAIQKTRGAFEPPKYIASLIAAVNDGAKSAQGGAFLFLAIGLYLLATAFSATDEDLLLGKTVTISQIGASLPASFSFAIAPVVFVFLHIYALVRYDLLAANVRHFVQELRKVPPKSDQERCRQLLANVEFIVALTAPRGSALYSRFWPWLFRGIVAVFPVTVLLLVQINALRYQSDLIVNVQRATLALDLAVLVWFFRRNALDGSAWPERRPARVRRWAWLLVAPVFIGAVNWFYLNTVPVNADARLVRYNPKAPETPENRKRWLSDAFGNPLDLISCPQLKWGCRFLRVDHRTLVDKVRDEKALGTLRMGIAGLANVLKEEATVPESNPEQKANAEHAKAMAVIEGAFLRDRSLRFAVLDESRLYSADLVGADLRGASLTNADLSGARLRGALLRGSDLTAQQLEAASRDLSEVNLSGLDLGGAELPVANLSDANLSAANLSRANLSHANLSGNLSRANLSHANLSHANLSGDLSGANLSGADLSGARLFADDLSGADLSAANLSGDDLSGANLSHANLSGANLSGANLNPGVGGTDLSNTNLSGANLSHAGLFAADLRSADLSNADLSGDDLSNADLSGAKNLTQAQLDRACGTGVKLLEALTLKPCPAK